MISLANRSPLGQAGGKRLHLILRRNWREKQSTELRSVPRNANRDRCCDFAALHSLKSAHALNPGLTLKPMFPRTIFSPHRLVARQSGRYTFPVATAVPRLQHPEPQPPSGFFTKKKLPRKTPERARGLWNRSSRNSFCSAVSANTGPSPETLSRKPFAQDSAPLEPCFSCVRHQPQQPVVQALQKV